MVLLDYDTGTAAIIIGLAGDYDATARQAILDQVAAVLTLHGIQEVALDMSQVTLLDATAAGAMIAAHRICTARGKRLTVRNPSTPVTTMLRLTGADTLFT